MDVIIRKIVKSRKYHILELPVGWIRNNGFPKYVKITGMKQKLILEALK